MNSNKKIIEEVENYYSEKFKTHGATAKGVDWNSEETQITRFNQLLKIIQNVAEFSLLDFGCGYGALLQILNNNYSNFEYAGFDISLEMLNKAKELFPQGDKVKWLQKLDDKFYDYSIASGIFNVKMQHSNQEWEKYIEETLHHINTISLKGFSFNMLTKYSDKPLMKDNLFYADPCYFFNYCKLNFSKNVALFHDYGLYEFSIIVRKNG